ncbi:MAG: DUF3180 family protein [Tessaracoccus sp.]|uniref:DUF3180 family protein n=1 Tax=Tessaracoccus sp. TaxID=1971211 RepID=UPI001EC72E64|nr:DUF3180 family protein [Tessaracoccus sp.]MBK7822597.1 DUF3180 family protein [Tessaracoccus sp.]
MSERPKLGLTTARQAVVAVLAGAAVSGMILLGFETVGGFPPVVPWSVPILLVLLAAAVVVYRRSLPKRRKEHKLGPQEGLAAVAIAKAMIVTGAVLAGGHVVYVMRYITRFDAPLPSARVIQGAATIVAALLLAGAGALLERACVVHDGDDDDDTPGGPGEPGEGTTGRGHPTAA